MTYLIWQMLACLIVAFLLGLLLGWWLGRRKLHDRLHHLEEKWRLKHRRCQEEREECRRELETCRGKLDECRGKLAAGAEPVRRVDADSTVPASAEDAEKVALMESRAPAAAAAAPDDLKKVEGIGPKIEGLLNARGVVTWSQLAAAEVSFLQSVLDDAGPRYRVHNPATWPRQAALAAAGAWDELKALQDRLKGGREG